MIESAPETGRIRVLPPEEARKIAAGEVIDRPAALVREFLDNAIDAGSAFIEVAIEGGGIRRIEVIDDGLGMGREDLALCWYTHATSKIRSIDDLNAAETLGFRGEALAAAAAVSRLEILSCTGDGEAWLLETGAGMQDSPGGMRISRGRRTRGTSVRALGLFDTIPARKRFLKREGAEAGLCRQAFIDKALAFPGIAFRFIQQGKLKHFFPPAASLKERYVLALLSPDEGAFLHEISARGQGFSAVVVVGGPELYRQDRRQEYVFANGRRINDFSLLQALEYGVRGWFPNGVHPVGAIFIDIDPSLADFNIHPAKREVRFRDPGAIHHSISSALENFTRHHGYAGSDRHTTGDNPAFDAVFLAGKTNRSVGSLDDKAGGKAFNNTAGKAGGKATASLAMEALLEHPPSFAPLPGRGWDAANSVCEGGHPYEEKAPEGSIRFAGRVFGLFLLVEREDRLFIIDQHAAHERILYNQFLANPIPRQELLIPIPFHTDSDTDDRFLENNRETLAELGIGITGEDGSWYIEALPVNWRQGDAETVREILNLRDAGENIAERWAATLCCHSAVRDGDYLDEDAALALATEALSLPIPRCPHGRPVWVEISREELFRAVRRL
ncbi:MAG: DNA mismatch repair endonuclease MutL [Spirochaetaceae bacterium]|jgi:DNA mismatch repair protein MutL|nr:DNA mismatch repair endonuclease MutL [Spirochaetaceae bacterium]